VSIRSGFPVFGQNREPEPGYPGSLFWETGTGTGTPVKPGSRLPAGSGCTRFGNRFLKKIIFELILGIGPKISPFFFFFFFFFHKLAILKKICIESNWVLKRERKKESDIYIYIFN
jgi:hypothetical protein